MPASKLRTRTPPGDGETTCTRPSPSTTHGVAVDHEHGVFVDRHCRRRPARSDTCDHAVERSPLCRVHVDRHRYERESGNDRDFVEILRHVLRAHGRAVDAPPADQRVACRDCPRRPRIRRTAGCGRATNRRASLLPVRVRPRTTVCARRTRGAASASPTAATSKRAPLVTNTGRGVHGRGRRQRAGEALELCGSVAFVEHDAHDRRMISRSVEKNGPYRVVRAASVQPPPMRNVATGRHSRARRRAPCLRCRV